MSRWILRGGDAARSPLAGAKARSLARAEAAGLPVPEWFVLSASAMTESLTPGQHRALHEGGDPAVAQAALADVQIAPAIAEELARAVAGLAADGRFLAVRSSALEEDGARCSFAGQLESYLDVEPRAVAARVCDVWRSSLAARALAYRREHGLSGLPDAPAVIVQRMVHASAAGVAFTTDPIGGRRDVVVVNAVAGAAAPLVGGQADAETWRVETTGASSPRIDARPLTSTPVLTPEQAIRVTELARAAERAAGSPQDIEWAIADRLVLLQSRPITGRADDPAGARVVWDNSNLVESYSGITLPLTFSFVRDVYAHVYEQFCREMGVPERAIAARAEAFRNLLGLIRGRLYYNLLNWYRILALLPGYRLNRQFMEQMMGVKQPLPEAVAAAIGSEMRRGRVADAIHLARTAARLVRNHLTIDRRVAAFTRRLDAALATPDPPLDRRTPEALVAHYRELRAQLLLRWDAPLVNDFLAMVFYGVLRRLSMRWCGDEAGTLANALIRGGGMVSTEPAVRLKRIADLVAPHPSLVEALAAGGIDEIQPLLAQYPDVAAEVSAYLARFGERTINELKLESSTLCDDPRPLLRAAAALARQAGDPADAGQPGRPSGSPSSAGGAVLSEARGCKKQDLTPVFTYVLRQAQRRVRDRENLRLERTRLFGRVRRIFLALGERFARMGVLEDPRDVMFLEVDEVLAFVEGRATCTNLAGLVALRKLEWERHRREPAPDDRFETSGPVYVGHDFRGGHHAVDSGTDARVGLGCSPGVVQGVVRIVRDPHQADLRARHILVAEHTDPGWVILFPFAQGVLVERGSLLSHAAIVARELGIPAVVALPGVTDWLRDGDRVEMNGMTGLVRRVAACA